MGEIGYGNHRETADLAGLTIGEVRGQFKADFGIPDKARATLNGNEIRGDTEADIVLADDASYSDSNRDASINTTVLEIFRSQLLNDCTYNRFGD